MTTEQKIDSLTDAVNKTNEKVDLLAESLNEMKEKVDKIDALEKDVKELKEQHDIMNQTLILIQEDTSTKIPALFDGHSFHQQHIEQNDKRLDVLEIKVDNHSNRLWALEHID